MSIVDDLAVIAADHNRAKSERERFKKWEDASRQLFARKEAAPWGGDVASWATAILNLVVASKELESLLECRDPELILSGQTTAPFTRLQEVLAQAMTRECRPEYRVAAKIMLCAVETPTELEAQLAAVLSSERIETIRVCLESIVDAAYFERSETPPKTSSYAADDNPLVTAEDIARMVLLERSSFRRYEKKLPQPEVPASGQSPKKWRWLSIRPKLVEIFPKTNIPEYPQQPV